jgi:hypothetical protein
LADPAKSLGIDCGSRGGKKGERVRVFEKEPFRRRFPLKNIGRYFEKIFMNGIYSHLGGRGKGIVP